MGLSEGEGHGLELSGNFTSLWPPLSQMDSVCSSSDQLPLARVSSQRCRFLHSMTYTAAVWDLRILSATEGQAALSGQCP